MKNNMNYRNRQMHPLTGIGRVNYEQMKNTCAREPFCRATPLGRAPLPWETEKDKLGCGCQQQENEKTRLGGYQDRRESENHAYDTGSGCGCSRRGRNDHAHIRVSAEPRDPRIPSVEEGCGCGCEHNDSDCAKMKKQLQTIDFALYEVILYLDAYPDSAEALNTYHLLLARRKRLAAAYEQTCGPLTAWGNISTASWDWVKGPAPWEYPKD